MKFERPKGFVGSIPRNWIDKNLPKCPFCKTSPSLWEGAIEYKWIGINRYHFRCPKCMAVISIPVAAIAGLTIGRLILEKKLRIESVGNHQKLQHLVGEEYSLEVLQEWARRIRESEK